MKELFAHRKGSTRILVNMQFIVCDFGVLTPSTG